jgi:hypothetical protein
VISKWALAFSEFPQIDTRTVQDVVVQIRYVSNAAGGPLKDAAVQNVKAQLKSVEDLARTEGLFAFYDLRSEYASAWYKAMHPGASDTERVIVLGGLGDRLPFFTVGKTVRARNMLLFTPAALGSKLKVVHGSDEVTFGGAVPVGAAMNMYASPDDQDLAIDDWEVHIADKMTAVEAMLLVIRYVITNA